MTEGLVLQSASVGQMARDYPRKNNTIQYSDGAAVPEKTAKVSSSEDTDIPVNEKHNSGAVIFLFPPNGHLPWSLSTMWLACKLWILEIFNPVKDKSCKDEVKAHDSDQKQNAGTNSNV
jgi:hypothetical protein